MIICNDIWAYLFGFFFGKTPLIKLSPKKTWEGYIGGGFATLVYAAIVSKHNHLVHCLILSGVLCLLYMICGVSNFIYDVEDHDEWHALARPKVITCIQVFYF